MHPVQLLALIFFLTFKYFKVGSAIAAAAKNEKSPATHPNAVAFTKITNAEFASDIKETRQMDGLSRLVFLALVCSAVFSDRPWPSNTEVMAAFVSYFGENFFSSSEQ